MLFFRSARLSLVVSLACLALFASACTWEKAESTTPEALPFADEEPVVAEATTTSTTTMAPVGCVGRDFSVNYPSTWFASERASYEDCFWFSSAPISDRSDPDFRADYVPEITIITERRYEDALGRITGFDGDKYALVDSNATNVNGYPATMFDVLTKDGDATEASRSRIVIVDIEGEAITMRATEATVAIGGAGVDYDETLNALEMILNSLIIPR